MVDDVLQLLKTEPWKPLVFIVAAIVAGTLLQFVCYTLGRRVGILSGIGEILQLVTRPLIFFAVLCGVHAALMAVAVPARYWYASALFSLFISVFAFGFIMTAVKRG